jgi:putative endonuclease
MEWYVYVAKAGTGKYYTGITTNPEKRIACHNSGRGSNMARQQGPFTPMYVSGAFANRSEAQTREYQIKGWTRSKKEKLIAGIWK